jgi:hypothetical protein
MLSPGTRWLPCLLVLALAVTVGAEAVRPNSAEVFDNPKAKVPPPASPQRRSGAEGVPPLPLPATPLRRTELKRQPSPPALVGMINLSGASYKIEDSRRVPTGGYPTTTIDIERLMNVANSQLGIRYRYVPMSLESFSYDPTELPLLYLTGWTPMPELSDELVGKLRRYLYDGGTLVLHAQCGRGEFIESARRQIARLLPDRPLAPLDTDSPLFHARHNITQMRFRKDSEPFKTIPPYLEAVYLGCRPAIIFSPIDLNCGWDVANRPIEGGVLYHQDDAIDLGVNIITATLANLPYARSWGVGSVLHEQNADTRDQLVIAQVIHDGDWDPTPHALANLMAALQRNTTLNVQFKRQTLDLAGGEVFQHPVLFMTGLRDFKLSDAQAQRLHSFLKGGGVLIADASAGNRAFDAAFRREIKRVLGDAELKPLPLDSPLYQMPYDLRSVGYTDFAKAQLPGLTTPSLEGVELNGQLAVIYSSLGLSNGWEQLGFAYNRGYANDDALRLGVNIFCYALTH